jgi:putative oxidoreductase
MFISDSVLASWAPRMLSVLRIVVALLYLQHGLTKFFGFPGSAPASMPFFPVILGGIIEVAGSILLLIGLFSRPAAFVMSGEMAIAYWYAHFPRNPFPYNNGGSLAILYCFVFLYIVFAGPGPWSVDAARGQESRRPATT